jgi:hypothetical protein
MKKLISIISVSFVASPIFANSASDNKSAQSASINIKSQPNIVLIYADDIGYGDLSSYGAKQVNTPNTDTLAANGIRFTNAHSAAATSTPSRYGLFTGEYQKHQSLLIFILLQLVCTMDRKYLKD